MTKKDIPKQQYCKECGKPYWFMDWIDSYVYNRKREREGLPYIRDKISHSKEMCKKCHSHWVDERVRILLENK